MGNNGEKAKIKLGVNNSKNGIRIRVSLKALKSGFNTYKYIFICRMKNFIV